MIARIGGSPRRKRAVPWLQLAWSACWVCLQLIGMADLAFAETRADRRSRLAGIRSEIERLQSELQGLSRKEQGGPCRTGATACRPAAAASRVRVGLVGAGGDPASNRGAQPRHGTTRAVAGAAAPLSGIQASRVVQGRSGRSAESGHRRIGCRALLARPALRHAAQRARRARARRFSIGSRETGRRPKAAGGQGARADRAPR